MTDAPTDLTLTNYFRSGTSYRTRIGLNLKGLAYRYESVSLPRKEHRAPAYLAQNPQGLVPTLTVEGHSLIQSPAILEWLEETYPHPPLLPSGAYERAHVRAMAAIVGCDIHPVNNLRILNYLKGDLGLDQAAADLWCRHWIEAGFGALEALLTQDKTRKGFCFGAAPTLADCYLIPQVFASRRYKVDLEPFPLIREIDETCAGLKAFLDASPERQPDSE